MNSTSYYNKPPEFSPLQDTWKFQSSLNPTNWQPYPEFSKKENYQYALNTCNKSIAGPPATNGYTFSNPQPLKKEKYECQYRSFHYSNINNTWDKQQPYTL